MGCRMGVSRELEKVCVWIYGGSVRYRESPAALLYCFVIQFKENGERTNEHLCSVGDIALFM